jgi:hypothetical protein
VDFSGSSLEKVDFFPICKEHIHEIAEIAEIVQNDYLSFA